MIKGLPISTEQSLRLLALIMIMLIVFGLGIQSGIGWGWSFLSAWGANLWAGLLWSSIKEVIEKEKKKHND